MSDILNDAPISLPAPAAEPTPAAPAAPVSATPNPGTPAPATPGGAPDAAMVPSYRLRETREAALREAQSRYEQKERDLNARFEQVQKQLHTLVGAAPPANPEVDKVKEQFFSLFPWAKKMEERFSDFESLADRAGDLEAQNAHYWQSYGKSAMDRLFTHAQDSLGAPLTDEGKRQLHSSFTGWIQSSPELTARYASDPSIVEDFWKQFTSSFIDPVRRTAAAGVAARVPGALPQDSPSGAPRSTPAPSGGTLDERVAAGWAQYNQGKV